MYKLASVSALLLLGIIGLIAFRLYTLEAKTKRFVKAISELHDSDAFVFPHSIPSHSIRCVDFTRFGNRTNDVRVTLQKLSEFELEAIVVSDFMSQTDRDSIEQEFGIAVHETLTDDLIGI